MPTQCRAARAAVLQRRRRDRPTRVHRRRARCRLARAAAASPCRRAAGSAPRPTASARWPRSGSSSARPRSSDAAARAAAGRPFRRETNADARFIVGAERGSMAHRISTSVVGSYPQPDWLVDRRCSQSSWRRACERARFGGLPPERLDEAQDDATIVAIREQERAGIDIITDGEIRRESYSNRFANALDGIAARPRRRGHRPHGHTRSPCRS